MELHEVISAITPADGQAMTAVKKKWDSIAKPLHGMGLFEDALVKIGGIQRTNLVDIAKKCVAVACADNGVVEEGVTQTGSEVTAIVAGNMTRGDSSVAIMAKCAGADVFVYDVGMLTEAEGVSVRKCASGTKNFAHERAMTREEAEKTILEGVRIVKELKDKGYNLIATGEMGIGNTTTSSAVTSVLLDVDPAIVTGKGAGLSTEGIKHKTEVIRRAIEHHSPDPEDPIDILSCVGGFDIAAMCGMFLGGALYRVTMVVDGLIASVAALLAARLAPAAKDYMLASHSSAEPAAVMILKELSLQAPIMANMALGEGTGAAALMPLLDMTVRIYYDMPTFGGINIEEYKPLQ